MEKLISVEEDWCLKGHSGIVLDGGFALDFNGRLECLHKLIR